MQRVGFVLLTVGGLASCGEPEEEPLCAPADEVLAFEDADQDGFGADAIGFVCQPLVAGQSLNNVDCDDNNALVFPGAIEVCDDLDNNCDGRTDEGFSPIEFYLDIDGDGYGDPDTMLVTCEDPGVAYVLDNNDCNDDEIGVSPAGVETCDNALDDDCNGIIDDRVERQCDDGKDGDCDGFVDCGDGDCLESEACNLGCADGVIEGVELPVVYIGSTTSSLPNGAQPRDDNTPAVGCAQKLPFGEPDITLQWRVPATGTYTFSTVGSAFDTVLTLFVDQCEAPQACNDDAPGGGTDSLITRELIEGALVLVVVDGIGSDEDRGTFQLTIDRP